MTTKAAYKWRNVSDSLSAMVSTDHGHMAIDCTGSGMTIEEDLENARLISAAPELLDRLERSTEEHLAMADLLDAWARESVEGGWSTHQVDAMRKRADACRRFAADNKHIIRKAEEGS